jgi:hypothetical protein
LRLFLLLSAMLAGLTGLIAGGEAHAREPAVIASALSGSIEQASESIAVRAAPVPAPYLVALRTEAEAGRQVFAPQSHPVDERRIE